MLMTRGKQGPAPTRLIDKTNWHCAAPGRRIPTVDRPRSNPAKVLHPNRTERRKSVMEKWRELNGQNRKVINLIGYKPGKGDMIVAKPSYSSSPQSDGTAQKRDGEMEKWRELDGQSRKVINFIGYKPGTGDMIVAKPGYSSSPQTRNG